MLQNAFKNLILSLVESGGDLVNNFDVANFTNEEIFQKWKILMIRRIEGFIKNIQPKRINCLAILFFKQKTERFKTFSSLVVFFVDHFLKFPTKCKT